MSQLNPLTRELLVKLVYYGPGLGGKTTTLERVHAASPPESRGQIVSLATPVDRTLYFDFLPLRAPTLRDHHLRLQLFTVPGQVYFNATRKLVLTGADGVVFVADSQAERQDANHESLENLSTNLMEQGRSLADLPFVLQYNKRDLPGVLPIETLDAQLNSFGVPTFATSALTGEGVMEGLDTLLGRVIEDLERRGTFGSSSSSRPPALRFAQADAPLQAELGRLSDQILGVPQSAFASSEGESTVERERPEAATLDSHSAPTGPSWVPFFEDSPEELRVIEAAMRDGKLASAICGIEGLVNGLLVRVGRDAGVPADDVEPARSLALLGFDGARYMRLRRLARRARAGGPLDVRDALSAFATLIEVRARYGRALS